MLMETASGERNSGRVTPTIIAKMAITPAMTVTPPSVIIQRAILSQRRAFRLEEAFILGMNSHCKYNPKRIGNYSLFQLFPLFFDHLGRQHAVTVLDDDFLTFAREHELQEFLDQLGQRFARFLRHINVKRTAQGIGTV